MRYDFLGKNLVDALIDLPLALPTAVAGISLTAIYAPNGVLGQMLDRWGIQVAFTRVGVILAMVFVGLPFAVRTVQPVLMELDPQSEEAAAVLGASRWFTFRKVILRALIPPMLTGFALAFARAVGEYGSIVFISGNLPMQTEIVPLLIVTKLEQYQYSQATALAMVMLAGLVRHPAGGEPAAGLDPPPGGPPWLAPSRASSRSRPRSAAGPRSAPSPSRPTSAGR